MRAKDFVNSLTEAQRNFLETYRVAYNDAIDIDCGENQTFIGCIIETYIQAIEDSGAINHREACTLKWVYRNHRLEDQGRYSVYLTGSRKHESRNVRYNPYTERYFMTYYGKEVELTRGTSGYFSTVDEY